MVISRRAGGGFLSSRGCDDEQHLTGFCTPDAPLQGHDEGGESPQKGQETQSEKGRNGGPRGVLSGRVAHIIELNYILTVSLRLL